MTHCVTCCQALPAGMKHPEFFGQSRLEPDATAVYDLHDELDFLLSDIAALLNIVYDREAGRHENHRDIDVIGALGLLQNLAAEAQRRALRLRNAGLYWQGIDRNDGSLFPDLPPPRQQTEDCPHTVYDAIRGCHACGKQDPYGKEE